MRLHQMSLQMEQFKSKKALVMKESTLDALLHTLTEVFFSCFLSLLYEGFYYFSFTILNLNVSFWTCSIRGASAV
jgi:hypothetical protein